MLRCSSRWTTPRRSPAPSARSSTIPAVVPHWPGAGQRAARFSWDADGGRRRRRVPQSSSDSEPAALARRRRTSRPSRRAVPPGRCVIAMLRGLRAPRRRGAGARGAAVVRRSGRSPRRPRRRGRRRPTRAGRVGDACAPPAPAGRRAGTQRVRRTGAGSCAFCRRSPPGRGRDGVAQRRGRRAVAAAAPVPHTLGPRISALRGDGASVTYSSSSSRSAPRSGVTMRSSLLRRELRTEIRRRRPECDRAGRAALPRPGRLPARRARRAADSRHHRHGGVADHGRRHAAARRRRMARGSQARARGASRRRRTGHRGRSGSPGPASTSSARCHQRSASSGACPFCSIRWPRGSGVKVKTLESLACGVPVVTTPFGAEGVDGGDGHRGRDGDPENWLRRPPRS